MEEKEMLHKILTELQEIKRDQCDLLLSLRTLIALFGSLIIIAVLIGEI